ncbi:MAG: M28 family peptidase [Promethearchaeota archaeon]
MRTYFLMLLLLLAPLHTQTALQYSYTPAFNGANAFSYLTQQCDFGPRPPGSENLSLCREYIVDTLESFGWTVTLQNFTYDEVDCTNVIARFGSGNNESVILGSHYDTRPRATADPDPQNHNRPVLGANDGASSTAALLELARILPNDARSIVELVFFDAEDSGGIDVRGTGFSWDYIVGSNYYVDQLSEPRIESIRSMILLDMIGDENLRLLRETSSTDSLQDDIWNIAGQLGHGDIFLDSPGGSVIDDHRPFLSVDIPSLDMIHHAPFPSTWHTVEDIPERCSASSLEVVGGVVEVFLVTQVDSTDAFVPDTPLLLYAVLLSIPIAVFTVFLVRSKRF